MEKTVSQTRNTVPKTVYAHQPSNDSEPLGSSKYVHLMLLEEYYHSREVINTKGLAYVTPEEYARWEKARAQVQKFLEFLK